ncbi:MAG: outer membrane protein assembly factor BamC [Burkholderiaceae bacterium]|nr:outer membrane protein assembly factor BamC [Burkholderiaceae bacterium]
MIRARLFALSVALFSAGLLVGCESITKNEVDYKSADRAKPLEVPPDLIAPGQDDRFAVPSSGTASRSEFDRSRLEPRKSAGSSVLPAVSGMRIERQGDQRVLIVEQPVEKLWPVVRQFWLDNGFVLAIENPETGILETEWAENRAKIPEDIIRRTLGKVFDRLYDTGERDKFRTRLDRIGDIQTEIVISHRGVVEIATTSGIDFKSTWTNRPPDRDLEADFIRRLMLRLGADQSRAQTLMAQSAAPAAKAQVVRTGESSSIEISEPFDRAWRRVGVAIDRLGFTVEDRDRAKGMFFVRYRDPTAEKTEKKGFFSNLFSSGPTRETAETYRINVVANGMTASRVSVLDKAGKPTNDVNAQRMLSVLFEQLK